MPVFTSSSPYYDDFDQSKGFQQILFKPGYAVQARELTQLQTLLKDQISKFGKHIFKQGSVVIPGNVAADTLTPYIKIESTYGGNPIDIADFVGATIRGPLHSGEYVEAVVKHIEPAVSSDPITLYLIYTKGAGATGINNFQDGENITVYVEGLATSVGADLLASNSFGSGSLVHVNSGVFFINGNFVYCNDQTIAISKYTTTPSCHVMLQIVESIVDADADESLLDPSNGSYNYAAPGADRLKVELKLTSLGLSDTVTSDYVELMRFRNGIMEANNRYAQYSELEKTLARRTFDESGDYRVDGFGIGVRDHKKTQFNNGVSETGDVTKFALDIGAGKAYIGGYEIERIYDARLVLDKGRSSDHVKSKKISINSDHGRYIYVSDIINLPDFSAREVITLKQFNGGATVGTARVLSLDFYDGAPNTTGAVYKLFVHDVTLTDSYSLADIGYFSTAGCSGKVLQRLSVPNAGPIDYTVEEVVNTFGGARTAKVKYYARATGDLYIYKHSATQTPLNSEIITGVTSSTTATITNVEQLATVGGAPIFEVSSGALRAMKDAGGSYDTQYTVIKKFTVTVSGGTGSTIVSGGYFLSPEAGNTVIVGTSGVVSLAYASLTNSTTFTLSGGIANGTYHVITQFVKSFGQPKSKTKITHSFSAAFDYTISLGKCDIFKINSITDASGNDLKNQFKLDNGQTDFYYGIGQITFNGVTPPSGSLNISFDYFTHSGSGDYFNIDSYNSLEVVPGSYDYIPLIPIYRSKTSNKVYNLVNYIDHRPRIGETTNTIDIVVPSSITLSSIQYYVPRIDVIYYNVDQMVDAVRGTPSDVPKAKDIPSGTLKLAEIYVPAYTYSIDDILISMEKNKRYTMSDLSKMEDRLANVEYFSTLTASEQSLLTYEVPDAVTGLNRFKSGYLVDNFSNPFTICDYFNPASGVQFKSLELIPAIETHDSALLMNLAASSNYQITGDQITLPYTEVAFINQNKSTRVTNLNHFLLVDWNGHMTIVPSSDSWVETENLPAIVNTVNKVVEVIFEDITWFDPPAAERVQVPVNAPSIPAGWGDSRSPMPEIVLPPVTPAAVIINPIPAPIVPIVPIWNPVWWDQNGSAANNNGSSDVWWDKSNPVDQSRGWLGNSDRFA